MKKIFLNLVALIAVVSFVSCDKDYNSLGADIVGSEHFTFTKYDGASVVSYSKATGAVQSNNLPISPLGIYNDPVFGLTKASFVSQVELATTSFNIGDNPVIDSVYLYVPYFSHVSSVASSGEINYVLDSVYGYDENAKFDLKVYENNFKIRDFDPNTNFETAQKYYSNDIGLVEPLKGEILNTSTNTAQNSQFVISNKEIFIYKTNGSGIYVDNNNIGIPNQSDVSARVVLTRKTPGMWLDLKKSYFQQKILDQGATGVLFNNNTFKDFFKGMFFEVSETTPGQGSMAMLDFTRAELKIIYKSSFSGGSPKRNVYSLQMGYSSTSNRASNSIGFIEQGLKSPNYATGLSISNEIIGDSRLFLKGNDGSVAFIDLFGADGPDEGDTPDELDVLREKNWLINQANLVFYIDNNSVDGMGKTGQIEPERIYIFNATNNAPIIDYYADPSTATDVKRNKRGFGGIIERETTDGKRGIKYTVRLTEYINRLLNSDVEAYKKNIRIGVAVTESINLPQNAYIKPGNLITIGTSSIEFLPVSSVMSPLGTVLHGSGSTATYVDASGNLVPMKLKLEIYYTEPN